jgi:hypothetical protein
MTVKTKLIAFHGKQSIKDEYLARVRAHKTADQIIHGTYWQNGKGCAVGCTVHSNNHLAYEDELGIPRILARLEDGIFENLKSPRDIEWPEQFLDAVPVGADLSNVWPQFAVWMLIDKQWGVLQFAKTDRTKESIIAIAKFYQEGKFAKKEYYDEIAKIRAAAADAYAAAAAAADAAYAAADAAYDAAAADADADDAYAAAAAAADAADAYAAAAAAADAAAAAAADAADAAAAAAAAAYAAYDADADAAADAAYAAADAAADAAAAADAYAYAAKQKWRNAQADKLIELLKAAPIGE